MVLIINPGDDGSIAVPSTELIMILAILTKL